MLQVTYEDLLKAGVHYGHLTQKWNPAMRPYIYEKKGGIHLIDVLKSERLLARAQQFAYHVAKNGGKILYVGTKKQAKAIVQRYAEEVEMPYVVERWLGGTLTNFSTILKSLRKLRRIIAMERDGTMEKLRKKERLILMRQRQKMERILAGLMQMTTLPNAIYIVDPVKEHIALAEALRLNIPVIALIDTNGDPTAIEYPIPGNASAIESIELITKAITTAIQDGLQERTQTEAVYSETQTEEA